MYNAGNAYFDFANETFTLDTAKSIDKISNLILKAVKNKKEVIIKNLTVYDSTPSLVIDITSITPTVIIDTTNIVLSFAAVGQLFDITISKTTDYVTVSVYTEEPPEISKNKKRSDK